MILLAVVMIGIISTVEYSVQRQKLHADVRELMNQTEITYNNAKMGIAEKTEMFEYDYLNRAYAIDFMVRQVSKEERDAKLLRQIKSLMEVKSIHLISKSGHIIESSEENHAGMDITLYEQESSFIGLINATDKNAYVIDMNSKSMVGGEAQISIGIKSSCDYHAVVQIALDQSVYENLIQNETLASIVKNTPTTYDKAIFIIDKETNKIDAITKNNEQMLQFDRSSSQSKTSDVWLSAQDGKFVRLNGSIKYVITKELDKKILGVYSDADRFILNIVLQCIYTIVFILGIITVIGQVLKRIVYKYILVDLYSIQSNIVEVIQGDYDVTFETTYNTELRQICRILNNWKESYKTKSKRMTRVTEAINNQAAIFECLHSINQNFFSDNIGKLLDLDFDTWSKMRKTPKYFETYIKQLLASSNTEDGIVELNGKSLGITYFSGEDEFYGIIMDKTEEVKRKRQVEQELITMQEVSETDPLTGLANRRALEKYIRRALVQTVGTGIMILLDLDNFKLVNDQAGHPEGDKVLERFANHLKSCFGKDALVARLGGDEFAVFTKLNIPHKELTHQLEALLQSSRNDLRYYYNEYGMSVSIGAVYVDEYTHSYEDLYRRADDALYVAKRYGKDRVHINQ